MRRRFKLLIVLIVTMATSQLIILAFLFYFNYPSSVKKAVIGVTFAPQQAEYFNLDPKQTLVTALDDLKIKNYRLSVYWNRLEAQKGKYDFSEVDWQLEEVAKRDGKVILAIGRRLPRWPECHDPKWIANMSVEDIEKKILTMLETTVKRYRGHKEITAWQVENEPFLTLFGECPVASESFYEREVALVRSLDSRPIITTESGELSTWTQAARFGDRIGISIYKTTWNEYLGIFYYPMTPSYYKSRARAILPFGKKIFVSELQAEPWERAGNPLPETAIVEQKVMMNAEKLTKSVDFVKKSGFDEMYLWGVEWWVWLKNQGDVEMFNAVKKIVADNK